MKYFLTYGPSLVLALGMGLCGWVWVQGTMASVVAWYVLMSVIPALAILWLLAVGVSAAFRRTWGHWRTLGVLVGLMGLWPGLWNLGVGTLPFPLEENPEHELFVRVPLDGEVIVAWGGSSLDTNHHAFTPDQRWAYDLLVEPAMTGSGDLSEYGCYGMPVYAPVDGTVTMTVSDLPDQSGGQFTPDPVNPLGNTVVIRPAKGGFLVLAHLKPNSLTVTEGQTVIEGQIVGQCGNSGNTSEPHVHIHYQTQDPRQTRVNFALGRPLWFHKHEGPARPQGGIAVEGNQIRLTGDRIRHQSESE
ncbi:MAG: M23 family metallopeptidase [Myxococcota bacterium]